MDLFTAARAGDVCEVKKCLDRGVDVNSTDRVGDNALHMAIRYNRLGVVRCLIQRGANTEWRGGWYGWTPLVVATANNYSSVVRELLAGGALVNAQTAYGNTALALAASLRHTESVEVLLHAQADPNLTDTEADTPLHLAGMPLHISKHAAHSIVVS